MVLKKIGLGFSLDGKVTLFGNGLGIGRGALFLQNLALEFSLFMHFSSPRVQLHFFLPTNLPVKDLIFSSFSQVHFVHPVKGMN